MTFYEIIKKAIMMNCTFPLETDCSTPAHLIPLPENNFLLYIPDGVTNFSGVTNVNNSISYIIYNINRNIECSNKVNTFYIIGGKDVVGLHMLFINLDIKTVDLTYFNPKHLLCLDHTFYRCMIGNIVFGNFNKSYISSLNAAFSFLETGTLNLSGFDTSHVTIFQNTFNNLVADKLVIDNFTSSSAKIADDMFKNAKINSPVNFEKFKFGSFIKDEMFTSAMIPEIKLNHDTIVENIKNTIFSGHMIQKVTGVSEEVKQYFDSYKLKINEQGA